MTKATNAVPTRTGDPETSHRAAATWSLDKLRTSQREVLNYFRRYGPMDDRSLMKVAADNETKQSVSSLRTRRSELAKGNMARLVELADEWLAQRGKTRDTLTAAELEEARLWCRSTLRREGFRSPLWDTGERVTYEGGRMGIVWGLAE
jgi:hypothetical protein